MLFTNASNNTAPWFHTQPRAVLSGDRKYLTFASGGDDGDVLSSCVMAVGPDTAGCTCTYRRNFANNDLGFFDLNTIANTSILVNPWAAGPSGSAKPFTLIFSGQTPPGGAPIASACILSFTSATLVNPRIVIAYGALGSTAFFTQRINDANTAAAGPNYDPGLNPFVFYWGYDGANFFTSLNGGVITQTVANGGTMTIDQCAIGMYARSGTLRSRTACRSMFLDNQYIPQGAYLNALIRYKCRKLSV